MDRSCSDPGGASDLHPLEGVRQDLDIRIVVRNHEGYTSLSDRLLAHRRSSGERARHGWQWRICGVDIEYDALNTHTREG